MLYRIFRSAPFPLRASLVSTWDWLQGIDRYRVPRTQVEERHLERVTVLTDRLAMLNRMPKGGRVVELGVDSGDFSAEILARTAPRKLHLVDIWSSGRFSPEKRVAVERRFAKEIAKGRVSMHVGLSHDVLARFEDASLDWLYIDTTHRYETTQLELSVAARKMRPNGLIAGHDYTIGNWQDHLRYGVIEAVNEFCLREDWGFLFLTHEPDRHLSFALYRLSEPPGTSAEKASAAAGK